MQEAGCLAEPGSRLENPINGGCIGDPCQQKDPSWGEKVLKLASAHH